MCVCGLKNAIAIEKVFDYYNPYIPSQIKQKTEDMYKIVTEGNSY